MKRCHGLAGLLMIGLIAAAARAEPPQRELPASGPKLGAKIVPLKPHKRGHVSGSMCWSCFG